jgi:hypothetical protein
MSNHKLAIIVPYRDRFEDLIIFKKELSDYLNNKGINYELIIVEQDKAKTFNRGKLLNIGFMYAKRMKCDYVIFHDIDMIPLEADYGYEEYPVHLSSNFVSTQEGFTRTIFDEYFGGVTMFPVSTFEDINGYSNEYWGWGYEDNDLLHRCRINRVSLDKKEIKMMGGNTAALQFSGKNTYVECKNNINFGGPLTFFISFYPDDLSCDHEKYDDTFVVFGIPGLDLQISYNSYCKYNFELWDINENIIYFNTDIKLNYKTNIAVTIDPKTKSISMYQDGELVGTKEYEDRLYNYKKEDKFYLGCADPNRSGNEKFFKGLMNQFAVFSSVLSEAEIKEISNNKFFALTQSFGDYQSQHQLKIHYDAKFVKNYKLIDLSGYGNDGVIHNCNMVGYTFEDTKIIEIPYRKNSTYKLIPHEENGYVGNGWKSITTRYNQLRYYNEVAKGFRDSREDGLSNLTYKELNRVKLDNQTHIVVSI